MLGNGLIVRVMFVNKKSVTPGLQDFTLDDDKKPKWLKSRGYLHITPKINVKREEKAILSKVQNPEFVKKHGFFPLIHSIIKERKFKKHPDFPEFRAHSYFHKGEHKKSVKNRPLHYATHIDALIFGYYAQLLLDLYEVELEKHTRLSECITAYRKVPLQNKEETGKSTINFADEAFREVNRRAKADDCVVLMFDIKSFFSNLNHEKLKKAWFELLGKKRLPEDHFNVFKAATNFRYILRDELRKKKHANGVRSGFDERKLSRIRKKFGKEAFFESEESFRYAIKSKQFIVYKNQFVKNGIPVGIPQGLPISAVLANLYLLEFDLRVLDVIVKKLGGYYRRYSDDILIICKPIQAEFVKEFIMNEIEKSSVSISPEKTETYLFKVFPISINKSRIVSIQLLDEMSRIEKPLNYLGFEYNGNKTLIKSTNLARFYRRMIYAVKRKAQRAVKVAKISGSKPIIFKSRLIKLYKRLDLDSNREKEFAIKRLKKNERGEYAYKNIIVTPSEEADKKSNYISYVQRASSLMKQKDIYKQARKRRHIFNESVHRHLKREYNKTR